MFMPRSSGGGYRNEATSTLSPSTRMAILLVVSPSECVLRDSDDASPPSQARLRRKPTPSRNTPAHMANFDAHTIGRVCCTMPQMPESITQEIDFLDRFLAAQLTRRSSVRRGILGPFHIENISPK